MTRDKLVAVQHAYPSDPSSQVPEILERAARSVEHGGIAVLPEYFYKPPGEPLDPQQADELAFVRDQVLEASEQTAGALVATVPELDGDTIYNTAIVAEDGQAVFEQRKIVPTPPEREAGIQAGSTIATGTVQGVNVGVLVCADVLSLRLVSRMQAKGVDVLAVPVLSPPREGADPTRSSRTSVFVGRAWDLGAYVVKAGGFAPEQAAGRSLIAAPWGLQAQADDEQAATLLACPLEEKRLHEAREPFDPLRESGRSTDS